MGGADVEQAADEVVGEVVGEILRLVLLQGFVAIGMAADVFVGEPGEERDGIRRSWTCVAVRALWHGR